MQKTPLQARLRALLLCLALGASQLAHGAQSDERIDFRIATQPIGKALQAFAEQSGLQVMYPAEVMHDTRNVKLSGSYTPAEALSLLLADSDLDFVYDNDGNVAIQRPSEDGSPASELVRADYSGAAENQQSREPVQIAQAQTETPPPATPAASETPRSGPSLVDEVVVTAQKREQSVQDVGISMTAFTGQQMSEMGFTQLKDVQMHTPGLQVFDYGSGSMTTFNLRGSAQNDFADHHEQPVAIYTDNVYTSFIGGIGLPLFDAARVEVLRGPQGTLFGRNATGGVLHLISNRPTREWEGYGEVQAGEYEKIRFEGAVGGPLTDTLSGRISVLSDNADGYIDNPVGRDSGDADALAIRGQLLFQPNDDLEILLNVRTSHYNQVGQLYGEIPAYVDPADGLVKNTVGGSPEHEAFCQAFFGTSSVPGAVDCLGHLEDGDALTSYSQAPLNADRDYQGVSGTITWDFEAFTLTSITDWQQIDKDYLESVEFPDGLDFISFVFDADSSQVSQELRLNGETDQMRWVVGAYYLNIDGYYDQGTNSDAFFGLTTDNKYELDTESYAFFGQVEYDITDAWTLIGGLRWTHDAKDIFYDAVCREVAPGICDIVFPGNLAQTAGPFSDHSSEGEWSGLIEADWHMTDDLMWYGKLSRGNKAGGYNSGVFFFWTPEEAAFDGEVLKSVEGGLKSTWMDGLLQFNAGAFYYDYENFQTFFQRGTSFLVVNVDSKVAGAEFEVRTSPWTGWEFMLGLSLLDAEQQDIMVSGITKDRPNPVSPDFTLNGLGRYEWEMFGGMMAAQMDFNWVDERSYNGIDHPALIADSYLLANARLSYTTMDDRWQLSFWVNNFTDDRYFPMIFDVSTFQGSLAAVPAPPQWFGGSVRFNWN